MVRKMVLIPETEYDLLKGVKGSKENEIKLSMHNILKEKGNTRQKAKKYSQLLGQFLRHKQSHASQQKSAVKAVKKDDDKAVDSKELTYLHIVDNIPAVYSRKAKTLNNMLYTKGVKWNKKHELVLPEGITILNSDAADLMKEALVKSKRVKQQSIPTGWKEFVEQLAYLDVPERFFTKSTTKQDINMVKEHGEYARHFYQPSLHESLFSQDDEEEQHQQQRPEEQGAAARTPTTALRRRFVSTPKFTTPISRGSTARIRQKFEPWE